MARFPMKEPPAGWAVIPFEGKWITAQVIKNPSGQPAQIQPLLADGDNTSIAMFQFRWQAINAANAASWWHGTQKIVTPLDGSEVAQHE